MNSKTSKWIVVVGALLVLTVVGVIMNLVNTGNPMDSGKKGSESEKKSEQQISVTERANQLFNGLKEDGSQYEIYTHYSRDGLVRQLIEDGYPEKDAADAVDALGADWNEQAKEAAYTILEWNDPGKQGLVDELVTRDLFTREQAEYGATYWKEFGSESQ